MFARSILIDVGPKNLFRMKRFHPTVYCTRVHITVLKYVKKTSDNTPNKTDKNNLFTSGAK